jgi:hypothetical protein
MTKQEGRLETRAKKSPDARSGPEIYSKNRFRLTAAAAELRLEFLHATRSIDEALFACIGWVRVHRHVTHDNKILLAVDRFLTVRLHRRNSQKIFTSRNIAEADWIQVGVQITFHIYVSSSTVLALTCFEAGIGLANDVNAALPADNLAVRMAVFQRLEGCGDFHWSEMLKNR